MWDLWCRKGHWDRFFSEIFDFPLSISLYLGCIAIYSHMADEQVGYWWPYNRESHPINSNNSA
jgi:hypothetical protein